MKKIYNLLAFLIAIGLHAQTTTILSYNFSTPWNTPAINNTVVPPIPGQLLQYYNSSNQSIDPVGTTGEVRTNNEGSYLELTFNTTNYEDINIQWYGEVQNTLFGSGSWKLQQFEAGTWVDIATDSFNILNARNVNHNLNSSANNTSGVKIRIVATEINSFILAARLVLDNLIITAKSPKIEILGNGNIISNGANAAYHLDTDFGIQVTSAGPLLPAKTYTVRNTGNAQLKNLVVSISGTNAADFTIVSSLPSTINQGQQSTFQIVFDPSADGKRTALVSVYSNADPSPYSFNVEGRGASCKSEDVVFKLNNMETGIQSLLATPESGSTFYKVSGYSRANAANPNTLGGANGVRLFGPGNNDTVYPLFTSFNTSWYVRGDASTVNFGPVDVTNEKGVFISFNLAAFVTSTSYAFQNTDYVRLEVLNPVTNTWSNEIQVNGGTGGSGNSRFSFTSGSTADSTYDGDNNPIVTSKASIVKLKIPGSSNFTNLVFRISVYNNSNNKYWLIDDVSVSTANAIYKTYTGTGATGWKNAANADASVPIIEEKAIIAAPFVGNLTACECEVMSGQTVSVGSTNVVRLENKLTNNGTFTIESDGNLVQNDDNAVNYGNILVKRNMTFRNSTRNEYNYFISPVIGANLKTDVYKTSTGSAVTAPFVLYHNEANSYFYNSSGVYVEGRSLAVKEPTVASGALPTLFFNGVPFNGVIDYALSYSGATYGYNLVGNPYPSNLDLNLLYANNNTEIESTFRFWDNTVNGVYQQQGSGYSGASYAIYNASTGASGTGLPAPGSGLAASGSLKTPNRIAKIGQGFMVKALGTGKTLKFKNSQRISVNTGSNFYSKNAPDNRYWLKLTSPTGMDTRIAIVYFSEGNKAFGVEDSKMTDNNSDALFAIVGDYKILIDGLPDFETSDVVDIGSRHFLSGEHTISLDLAEGIFENEQNIYLKDKQTGVLTNLSIGDYQFTASVGEINNRFEIVYKEDRVLGTNVASVKESVIVYKDAYDFVIKSSDKEIKSIDVFDVQGRLIKTIKDNKKEIRLNIENYVDGMYILKIKTENNIINKKIIK